MDLVKSGGNKEDPCMTGEQFDLIREFILRKLGIVIKGDKRLSFHMKISHRLGILGIRSYDEYYEYITSNRSESELLHLASHITNNETYFFREMTQLNAFSGMLNDMKRRRQKRKSNKFNILSAGCSSGEEAYTLNILLMESGLFSWGWETSIIGMDISKAALKKAQKAEYSKNSFRGVNGNAELASKYFESSGEKYTLKKPYRNPVRFVHANILEPGSFEGITDMDVIFCRNLLIYMSDNALERIVRNFHGALSDEGYLILGSSESLLGKTDLFAPKHREGIVFYTKNPVAGL